MPVAQPEPGNQVLVRFTKWDGSPHWAFDLVFLGSDEFGRWTGGPVGMPLVRPGLSLAAKSDGVLCFAHRAGYVATVNADTGDPRGIRVYVDITTPPRWRFDGPVAEVTMVDLDLDVVRRFDGEVYVDDEDEFAEHQISLGYPPALVAAARADCAAVLAGVRGGAEPFGEVAQQWLTRYRQGPHYRAVG